MQRIDDRTVVLTEDEARMSDLFDEALDKGHGVTVAAEIALEWGAAKYRHPSRSLDPAFVEWLSEGTLSLYGERIMPARCEALLDHVVLDHGETAEHITVTCGAQVLGVYDGDGDETALCVEHWPVSTVEGADR